MSVDKASTCLVLQTSLCCSEVELETLLKVPADSLRSVLVPWDFVNCGRHGYASVVRDDAYTEGTTASLRG